MLLSFFPRGPEAFRPVFGGSGVLVILEVCVYLPVYPQIASPSVV